jgi:general secretion pathway protein L
MNRLRNWRQTLSNELLAGAAGVGVYLDRAGLTLVHLEKGLAGAQVKHHLHLPCSLELLEDLSLRLQESVSQWGLQGNPVSLAVARDLGFSQRVSLPKAAAENLAQVVSYELDRFLPLPAENLFFDFQVLDETDTGINLMLMALPREPVERCLTLLAQAELRPLSLEPGPQAAANAYALLAGRLPASWALLRLEPGGLELAHIQGRALQAFYQLQGSFGDLPERLAQTLDRLRAEANGLKAVCLYGPEDLSLQASAVIHDQNLEVFPAQALSLAGMPAEADPGEAFPAVGAALRTLGKVPFKANLLPEDLRAPVKLGRFSLNKLLLLTLAGLVVLWLGSALIHKRVLLYQVNKQVEQITPQVRQVEKLLEESRNQVKLLQSVRHLEQAPDKLKILKDLTAVIPNNTWLFHVRISRQAIEMSGMSKSASDLIPLLEKSGWLTKTEFASPIVTDANKLEHFKIKAEIKGLEPAS